MSLQIIDAVRTELRPTKLQNKTMLLYRCSDCGKDIWVEPRRLPFHSGMCGTCSSRKSMKKIFPRNRGTRKLPFEALHSRLVKSSDNRGIPISLSYEEFLRFTEVKNCHYCDRPLTWFPYTDRRLRGTQRVNLDRKDNAEGYTVANCVAACIMCNRIKLNTLSYGEMLQLAPVLRAIAQNNGWDDRRVYHEFGRRGYAPSLPRRRNRGRIECYRPFEWLFNRLNHVSAKMGVQCTLTFDEFLAFTKIGECHYCGRSITWVPRNGCKHRCMAINLDRKVPSLGYSKDNVVVGCITCNRIKNSYLSYEDMMRLSPALRKIREQREKR